MYINYLTIDCGERHSVYQMKTNTSLNFGRKSEVESHLSASMRVGTERRVASCVCAFMRISA